MIDAKIMFLRLINSEIDTVYHPGKKTYTKDEILKIMKEDYNMSELDVRIMAVSLYAQTKIIPTLFDIRRI